MPIDTPAWVRDAVFYQIFPDRFARSDASPKPGPSRRGTRRRRPHGFKGGDLFGVVERLDYLADLGVNAIYFTPVFQSASNHRYHTVRLRDGRPAARRRRRPARAARRGPRTRDAGRPRRRVQPREPGVLPVPPRPGERARTRRISTGSTSTSDVLAAAGRRLPDRGDAPHGTATGTGRDSQRPRLQGLVGPARPAEVQHRQPGRPRVPAGRRPSTGSTSASTAGGSTSPTRSTTTSSGRSSAAASGRQPRGVHRRRGLERGARWLRATFRRADELPARRGDPRLRRRADLDEARSDAMTSTATGRPARRRRPSRGGSSDLLRTYHPEVVAVQLNLLGSHDMARVLTICGGDRAAVRLATLFQMTLPGAPCIYYGDEIGMAGGHDPWCRGSYPADPAVMDLAMRAYMRGIVGLRHRTGRSAGACSRPPAPMGRRRPTSGPTARTRSSCASTPVRIPHVSSSPCPAGTARPWPR